MLEWLPPPLTNDDVENEDFIGDCAGPSGRLDAEALLVRALVQEVHTAALITAGAACAVNIAPSPRGPRALGEARTLTAEFPARLDDWPRRILDEQISTAAIEDISGFYALFKDARTRLVGFTPATPGNGVDRAGAAPLRSLSTAWRLTCRHALCAAANLTEEAGSLLPAAYDSNLRTRDKLLNDAIAGGAGLCDESGAIHLPQMGERRRTPRRSLLQTVNLRIGNSDLVAFVRDVSLGGFGLTRMPPVDVGSPVLVELASGRVLRGRIVWSNGENAGLRFDRPLRPTDPLLFG